MLEVSEEQKNGARSDDDTNEQNEDVPTCRDLRQRNVSRQVVVAWRVLYFMLFEQVRALRFVGDCRETHAPSHLELFHTRESCSGPPKLRSLAGKRCGFFKVTLNSFNRR